MISAFAILILSTALFFFYIQTLCDKILRREFSRPYFREILDAIELEFPRVRQAMSVNAPMNYSQTRLALRCDFLALTYMVRNANLKRRRFSVQEMILVAYFRVLLFWLAFRHVLHFREKECVIQLTVILRHFANLVGERIDSISAPSVALSR